MAEIVDSNAGHETETKKTSNGSEYSIGGPQVSGEAVQSGEPDSNGPPFSNHPVDWVPGDDWEDTDPVTAALTGITRWKIDTDRPVYPDRLWFITFKTFDYTFFDKPGQGYLHNNVTNTGGMYYIDYNSFNPTIVSISGR